MTTDSLNFAAIDTWLMEQGQKKLSEVQHLLLQACTGPQRLTYEQFAAEYNYSAAYVRCRVAKTLWQQLSAAMGERVTKSNCKSVMTQRFAGSPDPVVAAPATAEPLGSAHETYLEYPNGIVPPQSQFYIPRLPLENRCKRELLQPFTLLRIKAPHTMGKSSLLNRLLVHARSHHFTTVRVNFQTADMEILADVRRVLRWLCVQIGRALDVPPKLDTYWSADLGSKMSCSLYMKRYLLPQVQGPLVLALDEASVLFDYPEVSKEFFAMLRTWHEYTKTEAAWEELRLVLVQATDAYVQLNVNQSPFNVGLGVQLQPFSIREVMRLAELHPLTLKPEQLEQLHTLVAGHPYLIRLALYHLARQDLTFTELVTNAGRDDGIFGHHLQYLRWRLQTQPELMGAMQQLLASSGAIALPQVLGFKLQSTGLIQLAGDEAQLRCPLYQDYFTMNLAA